MPSRLSGSGGRSRVHGSPSKGFSVAVPEAVPAMTPSRSGGTPDLRITGTLFFADSMKIKDIHTHILPSEPGSALVCVGSGPVPQAQGHFFSVGLHPWDVTGSDGESFRNLDSLLSRPDVLALGESGLDALRMPPADIQEKAFIRQFELSETHSKPMILHVVRAFDRIIHLKKSLKPAQKWLIHGFRGGPEQARQLLGCGFSLSLGLAAREETVLSIPRGFLLAETDGKCGSDAVISRIAGILGLEPGEAEKLIESNISDFFA